MKYSRRFSKKKKALRKRKVYVPYYQASIKEIMHDLKIIDIEKNELTLVTPKKEPIKQIPKKSVITDENIAIESLVLLTESIEKIEEIKPEPQLINQYQTQQYYNFQPFWQYYPYFLYQNYANNIGQFGWYYN
ncbi:unnamed protein product [Blepharisma stoltei]|uniref:Uncharacterized protein n=1 Tax=Blepharisma stoltei TaxID=1481888 RepID=A0AAU9KCD8_9CILI|nr:unnamed protein product [Blepharisma stoltei]